MDGTYEEYMDDLFKNQEVGPNTPPEVEELAQSAIEAESWERDSLGTELVYYVGVLEETLPALSRQADRRRLVPWLRKLFSPELQLPRLRSKRNRYLFHLVLVTFSDRVFGVFWEPPKVGGLAEVQSLVGPEPPLPARWEADRYWQALLHGMIGKDCLMACWSHDHCSENEEGGRRHEVAGRLLDQEFGFFLALARPLVGLLPAPSDKVTAALWLRTLAKVRPSACLTMKAIRNDYIQSFLGYLQDLRLAGPFCDKPPESGQTLPPLDYLLRVMKSLPQRSLTEPSSEEAELFLSEQPVPQSGAFLYVAVTGRAQLPEAVSTVPLSTTNDLSYFTNI